MRFMHALAALLLVAQIQGAMAQTSTDSSPVPPVTSPTQGETGKGHHHGMGRLIKQLNLSQDQMSQIKQIVSSTPKGKERRQAIMAILTPEQKTQLKSLIAARRAQKNQAPPQN